MHLNYNKHLIISLKLISHKAYLLNKIRMYIDTKAAVTIYKTMILPFLEYGDAFYDGANQKLINGLQTTQNRICEYVYKEIIISQSQYYINYVI